jgi:isopentenyl-diphosphate Delta-isomerase
MPLYGGGRPQSQYLLATRPSEPMSEASEIIIPAIDAQGHLYPLEKMAAHQQGILHQAVSIFVFCGQDLLIQRRALSKYHCGGTWANTCCTHPHWDESLDDAADVTQGLIEHERVQIYVAHVSRDRIEIELNPEEVCDYTWANVVDLKEDAISNPHLYAPWFAIYLSRWDELGL